MRRPGPVPPHCPVAARLAVLPLALLAPAALAAPAPEEGPRGEPPPRREAFAPAARVLEEGVDDGVFPAAVAAAGTADEILWIEAAGRPDPSGGPPAHPGTLWDLASLTKVVGTTSVVLTLVRDGELSLDDPVARWVPGFPEGAAGDAERARRKGVTVEHLLTHTAGLAAWRPWHEEAEGYEELLEAVIATPLEAAPCERALYSDAGAILLGEVAARAGGKPLPQLERERVLEPLAMRHTVREVPEAWLGWTAPTERLEEDGPFLRGVVHDENARAAGGTTGHAGLFSTAWDLSAFAAEWLRALEGRSSVIPRPLAEEFVRRRELVDGSSRALGWDTVSPGSSAGELLSRGSFGHTGFTGTSLWIDPGRGLWVFLLSNRVCPTRDGPAMRPLRRALADAVARAFDTLRAGRTGGHPRSGTVREGAGEAPDRGGEP